MTNSGMNQEDTIVRQSASESEAYWDNKAPLFMAGIGDRSEMDVGYSHDKYGASFRQFGELRRLPRSGALVLVRQIPGTPQYRDAIGLYPFVCCKNWRGLAADISDLGEELVTLSLVTDPFGSYDEALLRSSFEIVRPFRSHFVADLQEPLNTFVSQKHRRKVRKALKTVTVEIIEGSEVSVKEWNSLYESLAKRHNIRGIRRFSEEAFAQQLQTPGALVFRASLEGVAIGIDIWYIEKEIAYNHLVAVSDLGYELHASYALQMTALEYLQGRVRFATFGGIAGLEGDANDGLCQFKRGWTNCTKPTYFCGAILSATAYDELCRSVSVQNEAFFPAYRVAGFI
jgi:hypothetical protein